MLKPSTLLYSRREPKKCLVNFWNPELESTTFQFDSTNVVPESDFELLVSNAEVIIDIQSKFNNQRLGPKSIVNFWNPTFGIVPTSEYLLLISSTIGPQLNSTHTCHNAVNISCFPCCLLIIFLICVHFGELLPSVLLSLSMHYLLLCSLLDLVL